MRRFRARGGFTLVEVMAAAVIFLIFITAVYEMYRAAERVITLSEDQSDVAQTGRAVLAQLNGELTCAYQPVGAAASELTGTDTEGAATDAAQTDTLSFLTTGHVAPSDQTAGDRCRVTYRIVSEGGDERPGLYVEEDLHPGLSAADAEPARRLISPLIVGMNCKYIAPNGTEWLPAWTERATLPVAVRVELTMQPPSPGATPVVMVTTANLPMAVEAPEEEETDAEEE